MTKLNSWKDHYWYTVPVMKKRIETIIDLVAPQGKTIIEVGCNEGFVSKALLENGASKVVPVDYDQSMVDKSREMFDIETIQGDINKLPFENGAFDIALGCEILEHIWNPFGGASELFRVAREKVVITVPVGEYWLGEKTHQWELNGRFIQHDSVEVYQADKDILALCFTRRRDGSFVDIPPFKTEDIMEKYRIGPQKFKIKLGGGQQ